MAPRSATLRLIVVTSLVQEILVQDIEQVGGHLGLAHGHRWLAMLEPGEVKSLRELARKEGNVTAHPLPLIRPKRRWDQRPARTASNQVAGSRSV
ncbi:MAG: hypothetical protein ACREX4_18830 [Gammaproteobacteria bacterium]